MIIKGFLDICAGIFSGNTLTFKDADVTNEVTLKRLTQDNHAGFTIIETDTSANYENNKLSVNSSYFVQKGFVNQVGFIKRG